MKTPFANPGNNTIIIATIALAMSIVFMALTSIPWGPFSPSTPTFIPRTFPPPPATCVAPNLNKGVWHNAASIKMLTPRSQMAVAAFGGFIYVPGGLDGPDAFEVLDIHNQLWKKLKPLPEGRNHLMAAALDGKVYVFGGGRGETDEATDTAWKYDPVNNTWSTVARMPERRYAGAAVALGDYTLCDRRSGGNPGVTAL